MISVVLESNGQSDHMSECYNPRKTGQCNIIINLVTHTQSMHKQKTASTPTLIPYLSVHSVAFKYNTADLNTGCYSVKLQGDSKINV